jgi:putative membrane protein
MKSVKGLEPTIRPTDTELKVGDVLALDRSQLAAERTLMAWVRTALSMISFGFTIYKFLQVILAESRVSGLRPQTPRNVGLTLIGIGTFALAIACIQHRRYVAQLIQLSPGRRRKTWDLSLIVAFLLLLLGILMFGSIVLRSGPFS